MEEEDRDADVALVGADEVVGPAAVREVFLPDFVHGAILAAAGAA
jgi:hypothetical protein